MTPERFDPLLPSLPAHLERWWLLYLGLAAAAAALAFVLRSPAAAARVGRLVRAEILKLTHHPFFAVSLPLIVLATVLGALLFGEEQEGVWRAPSAIAVFAGGAKVGLQLATFVVLIFGAMLFAGEFDRGTVKILLTRPITRTDLYAAKSAVAVLLSLFLIALVLYVALAVGCAKGELGPVWDNETYNSNTSYGALLGHVRRALVMSIVPILAAALLGAFLSNLVESSGFAIAMTLTLFLVTDEILLRAFRAAEVRKWFFNHYPSYALDVLRRFAGGYAAKWDDLYVAGAPSIAVPLASLLVFAAGGYLVFRRRNITA